VAAAAIAPAIRILEQLAGDNPGKKPTI
jgi:hypothetical protein